MGTTGGTRVSNRGGTMVGNREVNMGDTLVGTGLVWLHRGGRIFTRTALRAAPRAAPRVRR